MEKDDELKGTGNSYTTLFRQNDPRLGRWLSVDPKAAQMPWESPYLSMGGNPICRTDIFGDKWDESNDSQGKADGYREKANKQINDYNKQISSLEKMRSNREEGSKKYEDYSQQIENLSNKVNEIETSLVELDKLEDSDQVYRLEDKLRTEGTVTWSSSPRADGTTSYKDGVVVIQYWREGGGVNFATMAHELKHAYQFEIGATSFDERTGGPGLLYDLTDEQEAFKRGSAFVGGKREPLLNLTTSELIEEYGYSSQIPTMSLTKNTPYSDVYKAHTGNIINIDIPFFKLTKKYYPHEVYR